MTNTIYFNIYQDHHSCSTSSSDETSHLTNVNPSSSSLYLTIGKACLACAKPPIEPDDDKSTAEIIPASSVISPNSGLNPILTNSNLRSFGIKEIRTATRNFGFRFGPVFKGWIDENMLTPTKPGKGITIVVKRVNQETGYNHREWLAEFNSLRNLHHFNLVKLFGYCEEDGQRLLVYEFMPRGSLDNHIFRKGSGCLLSWNVRIKVALEAAKGLAFLHSHDVIHGNFKSSHILLDSEYNAKLSYLGSAKHSHVDDICPVALADNCAAHLSAKNDIYNFGVLLLELLSGRRAFDNNLPRGEQNLVEWAKYRLMYKSKVLFLLDTHLQGQYSVRIAQEAAQLALRCVSIYAKNQLNMMEVVRVLERLHEHPSL